MPREEFLAVSPFERKHCADCAFLVGYVNWWCRNEEAIKFRGTKIPGVVKCPFWSPDWKHIDKKYKTAENGYVYSKWGKFKNRLSAIFNK